MSAISGLIDLNGIKQEEVDRLKSGLEQYRFDNRNSLFDGHLFFDCGLQWITEESKKEILPYKNNYYCITADAIIDNREELMRLLEIDHSGITDSQLILSAYVKWGEECVDHLLGDYAFAIWDKQKENLFCVRDHVGKRTLYYEYHKGRISFSTILKPLINLQGKKKKLSERWLADFLAMYSATQEIEIDKTLYEEIAQLPPGHYLTFNKEGICVKRYWHPEKIKKLKLDSDEAYEKAFRRVFDEAVKCRLRSCGKVGVMMSSGLDSTAVGAVAAKILSERNETLEAFTEIPLHTYKSGLGKNIIVDESSYVEEMAKQYPNIHPHFSSFEECDSYNAIDEGIKELERPYKSVENIYWLQSLTKQAASEGCKVLLDGQFGNYTISQGYVMIYWNTLFKKLQWIKLIKEVNAFGRVKHLGRRYLYKKVFKGYWDTFCAKLSRQNIPSSIINISFAKRWHSLERIKKLGIVKDESKLCDCKKQKEAITNLILLSHIGCMETSTSLVDGLMRRDPTRDKRVIEFCLGVPQSQYIHHGSGRSLIRRAMKGMVPDRIRLNYSRRGKQAADWSLRLVPYQETLKQEVETIVQEGQLKEYINIELIKGYLEKLKQGVDKGLTEKELRELLYVIIFSRFMKQYQLS